MTTSIPRLIYIGVLMTMLTSCGSASKSESGTEGESDVATTQPAAMTPSESGQTGEVGSYYGAITEIVRIPIDDSAKRVQAPGESNPQY